MKQTTKPAGLQVTAPATLAPLITVPTAAKLIYASEGKVRAMCRTGEIKAVKVGKNWRVNAAALLAQFGLA